MKTFWNRPQLLNLKQIIQKILSNMIFIINILFNNNHLKENYFKHSVKKFNYTVPCLGSFSFGN